MPINPLVTIVCLCYNHELYLEKALNSVIKQDYNNIEIIIIDDFSSDNSVQKIQAWRSQHSNTSFIKNEQNLGNTTSFNQALQIAKGEFIMDFATDDMLLPNAISCLVKTITNSNYQNTAIAYANFNLMDETENILRPYFSQTDNPESGDIYKMVISRSTKLGSVAALMRTNTLKIIGGYDTTLVYEDLDAWVRISRNYPIAYVAKILANKRMLSNSLSSNFYTKKKSRAIHLSTLKIYSKILKLNKNKKEYQAVLKRMNYTLKILLKSKQCMLIPKLLLQMAQASIKSI